MISFDLQLRMHIYAHALELAHALKLAMAPAPAPHALNSRLASFASMIAREFEGSCMRRSSICCAIYPSQLRFLSDPSPSPLLLHCLQFGERPTLTRSRAGNSMASQRCSIHVSRSPQLSSIAASSPIRPPFFFSVASPPVVLAW